MRVGTRARVALALALGAAMASTAPAQDTIPRIRHILPIDYSRVRPVERSYDVLVLSGDSTVVIGQRTVALREVVLPDSGLGWLLTETRSGVVPSSDSVFLTPDLRPVRWTSSLGASRLEMDFVGDSIDGVIWGPVGTKRASLAAPPDLVLSGAMLELVVGLLPFAPDSTQFWVVAFRAEARQRLMRVDKATGAVVRTQEAVTPDVGTMLEMRARAKVDPLPRQ